MRPIKITEDCIIYNDMDRGWIRGKGQPKWHRSLYDRWKNMWKRCKDPKNPKYSNYKDCEIDEKYRLFSNYINEYYLKQFLIYQVYFVMGLLICRYSIFNHLYLLLQKIKGMKWIALGLLLCSPIVYIILLKLPLIHYFTFVIVTFILVYCIAQLPLDNRLLKWIGKSSTNIWLTHSFFCYYYFKEFIYAPRYSILIVIWLLFISLITSEVLNWLMRLINKIIDKIRINTLLDVQKKIVN